MGQTHRASPPDVVQSAGRQIKPAPETDVAALTSRELDLPADAVADAIERLITECVRAGPHFVAPVAIRGRT